MAFIKCSGGGKLKETELWDTGEKVQLSANTTITLSDSMQNYDYIKIWFTKCEKNTTVSSLTDADKAFVITIYDFIKQRTKAADDAVGVCMLWRIWVRQVYYVNDTSLKFEANQRIGNGTAYGYPNCLKVIGMKY